MLYEFSLPTKADTVPAAADWLHESKHDGYRMMLIREQDRVRLISRGGYDWAKDFPLIVTAALKVCQDHFVLDGEIVVLNKDGVSDFDALRSRPHDKRAQFYAFDMLAGTTKITANWRSCCARPTLLDCSRVLPMKSSSPSTSKARLAPSYSASPATWGL